MTDEMNQILSLLPGSLAKALTEMAERYPELCEVRLRTGRHLSVLSKGTNVASVFVVTPEMMAQTVSALCQGSLHTHMDTIKEGYIALPGGIRVGVCGRAIIENGQIAYIDEISSLNIRLPAGVYHVSGRIYDRIADSDFTNGVLIYSPPGVGKTTILRDLAIRLCSEGNRRVSLIDERQEIFCRRMDRLDNLDLFLGYPKAKAIEIATRTMAPQYILCDEIGSEDEAWSLLAVQSAGVPIIATAHAGGVGGLIRRSGIGLLHEAGMFDLYVGVSRNPASNQLHFSFVSRREL